MERRIKAPKRLQGTLNPPGDKSISHRPAILAALAQGRSTIASFLYGEDCLATLHCLEALGVGVRAEALPGGPAFANAPDAPPLGSKAGGRGTSPEPSPPARVELEKGAPAAE